MLRSRRGQSVFTLLFLVHTVGFTDSLQAESSPRHRHSTESLPQLSHPLTPSQGAFTTPSDTHDAGLPLSNYCSFDCGPSKAPSRVSCFVPRDGRLAIVPFSVSGASLCHSRRALCEQIKDVGKSPDTMPYVCKDIPSREILLKSEPTLQELGQTAIPSRF
ncbi:MAG: hypothetical protein HYR96_07290 [Deltaproteobacteria bacterium]|nr:hypothetical protein [Deltaproteobacteria bacterium]MBI3295145.1 hypothetical protein [Deltaproteobacteria bacterium]